MRVDDVTISQHYEQILEFKEDQIMYYCELETEVDKFLKNEQAPRFPFCIIKDEKRIGMYFL